MAAGHESQLRELVELYRTWQAYEVVCETCMLPELPRMRESRKAEFQSALRRYATSRYGRSYLKSSMAKAMDDVLVQSNQLTIF